MDHRQLSAAIDRTVPERGTAAAWWLGQHGFVLKLGKAIVYIDPFCTPLRGRQVAPLLDAVEIRNATLVLGSHDHADHIDRAAWPAIARESANAVFVVPRLLRRKIISELNLSTARVLGVDDGISVEAGGVRVTGVPAAHETLNPDPATGLHPCVGFVIEAGGIALYHGGDTCNYEGLQTRLKRWRFDAVFLPINGRDAVRLRSNCIGNMTYQEAADLAGALRPGLTVPAHFEMFKGNTEDPRLFRDYMAVKYPDLPVHVPRHGIIFKIGKRTR